MDARGSPDGGGSSRRAAGSGAGQRERSVFFRTGELWPVLLMAGAVVCLALPGCGQKREEAEASYPAKASAQAGDGRGAVNRAGGADRGSGPGRGGGGLMDWFSAELRSLEQEEAELKAEMGHFPAVFPDQQTDRIGYSSRPSPARRWGGGNRGPQRGQGGPGRAAGQENGGGGEEAGAGGRRPETRMIRLDLGSRQRIDRVVLVPADFAVDADPGAGYGFPVRWRVEVADEASFEDAVLLADHTAADFPNPGLWPVSVMAGEGTSARFVRLTAVKLWERSNRSLLALGEMMVLQGGLNLAAGLPREAVRVTDTDETPRNWSQLNLVDGQSVLGPPCGIEASRTEGYLSLPERTPQAGKWVQVDLGEEWPLEAVRMFPARAAEFPARRGFGFPARWRVEGSVDEAFTNPVIMGDWVRSDFSNPYENPVTVPVDGVPARYVRVTGLKLGERFNDHVLALSELEVYSGGRNVGADRPVRASDSRETRNWSTRFLTDGFTSQRRIIEWPDYLDALEERRQREARLAAIPERRRLLTAEVGQRVTGWVTGLLLTGAAAVWWSVRQNRRERRRELEALRQRIARDVHDEIGSGLGTISLLSQMAGARPSHPPDARQDFAEIHHLSREITESLRDIVWLIRPETRTLGDLGQRLRETADSMLAAVPHEFQVDAAVEGRELPLEFKRQVLLVFKEALHNLMRHARAARAAIRVGGDAERFTLELTDDGRGFDPVQPVSGAGLTGMRQRAETLGGTLEIVSGPGAGTRLRLAVPWP